MTTGMRIAQQRKEQNLSQEALGEALGVTRQAISKWESDASIPEVEKLVAMSRMFGVPVGWLLGVESPDAAAEAGALTENQLQMVEEIVARYVAALPKQPAPEEQEQASARRHMRTMAVLLVVIGAAVALLICVVSVSNLGRRADGLDEQYQYLQSQMENLSSDVSGQLWDVTDRMEEILESQNRLVASWSGEIERFDFAAGTVTFSLSAVPKIYTAGMTAVFSLASGTDTVEVPAEYVGGAFCAEATCPLTDRITQTVVFLNGDVKETQVLQTVEDSLHWSRVLFYGPLWTGRVEFSPGAVDISEIDATLFVETDSTATAWGVLPEGIYAGVFVNERPAAWMAPRVSGGNADRNHINGDVYDMNELCFPTDTVLTLEVGDKVDFVFLVRDNFGRVYGEIQEEYIVEEDRKSVV